MEARFIDDLRRQALALSEEAVPFLERQLTAEDRKSVAGLRRTAAQTRLTTLLMEAVAWLSLLDRQHPHQRSMRLATSVTPDEVADPGEVEPALAELMQRVVNFHRRLEHIDTRLDSGLFADPDGRTVVAAKVTASREVSAHT